MPIAAELEGYRAHDGVSSPQQPKDIDGGVRVSSRENKNRHGMFTVEMWRFTKIGEGTRNIVNNHVVHAGGLNARLLGRVGSSVGWSGKPKFRCF